MASLKEIHLYSKKGERKLKFHDSPSMLNNMEVSSSESIPKKRDRPSTNKTPKDEHSQTESEACKETVKDTTVMKQKEIVKVSKIISSVANDKFNSISSSEETGMGETEETEEDISIVPFGVRPIIQNIAFPSKLKHRILSDHLQIVVHNKKLIFSEKLTVNNLIMSYINVMSDTSPPNLGYRDKAVDIGLTLIQYFNFYIHKDLMYTKEYDDNIPQKAEIVLTDRIKSGKISKIMHAEMFYENKIWHYIYSPMYLLRLCINIPKLVLGNNYTDDEVNTIMENFNDFLMFMEDNFEKYFTKNDYE